MARSSSLPPRRGRRIPESGKNLFQSIYVLIKEYTHRTGLPPLNLSLGNPDGVPVEAIRSLQARFAADPAYEYHTYAEDKNILGFAEGMVELHGGPRVSDHPHLAALPIPGIKTASALIPLACGLHMLDTRGRRGFVTASNLPAYDIIGAWSEGYLGGRRVVWPLLCEDNMRLNLARLKEALKTEGLKRADLVFVIRPGNPASVGASEAEWRALCEYCLDCGTRLVNDAAYAGLAENGGSVVPLARVAKDYPDLEWLELYSVSKSFSDPGARLGAVVGSKSFIEDFALIKGNTDSGPVPSVMAAYGRFFSEGSEAGLALSRLRALYRLRLNYLVARLKSAGLKPACETEAGFFTLWKVPRRVLGVDLAAASTGKMPRAKAISNRARGTDRLRGSVPRAEAFNRLVTEKTGIVGVHFDGFDAEGRNEPLIRYAVCADVLGEAFQRRFEEALSRLNPEY